MSTYVIHDSATMLRRNFRHMQRYPIGARCWSSGSR